MTFWWLNWLLKLGFKQPIEIQDLGTLPETHKAFRLYSNLKEDIRKQQTCPLWKHLYRICRRDIILAGFTRLGFDIAGYIGPLALNGIVTYAINYEEKQAEAHYVTIEEFFSNGFVLVGVIFISSTLQSVLIQKHVYQCNIIGLHVRTAIQTLVYDKSLKLSSYSLSGGV
ncbi:ATP-binding cassette sub-family C member 8-like [Amphiura filiformis]|uniref:ATP-binding cassette sub-family C member 8-like n=1 Tax=Amphiura filiformis TaxID=82378 RepID=UPI003B20F268